MLLHNPGSLWTDRLSSAKILEIWLEYEKILRHRFLRFRIGSTTMFSQNRPLWLPDRLSSEFTFHYEAE